MDVQHCDWRGVDDRPVMIVVIIVIHLLYLYLHLRFNFALVFVEVQHCNWRGIDDRHEGGYYRVIGLDTGYLEQGRHRHHQQIHHCHHHHHHHHYHPRQQQHQNHQRQPRHQDLAIVPDSGDCVSLTQPLVVAEQKI